MALINSQQAIGAVSDLLSSRLTSQTSANTVDVGRPEQAAAVAGPKFNLFLYQIDVDGHMRNQPLDRGQADPLWLVLRYLLTAFDTGSESDTVAAHELLGEGMLALHELNFLQPSAPELADNPEPLKITFDSADSELLSKVLQGTDVQYRISAAFQIRPVMIAPSVAPRYTLPVRTVGPPGSEGVLLLPTLGARLTSVTPERFTAGTSITITGRDVNASITDVRIGTETFAVSGASEGQVSTTVQVTTGLSAGNYTLCVSRTLVSGMVLCSDSLPVQLLPEVVSATPGLLTNTAGMVSGNLTIAGTRLGGPDDAIFVAFYRDGDVALMLEATGTVTQTSLLASVAIDDAIAAGNYFIILRVNGVQAVDAPQVVWS